MGCWTEGFGKSELPDGCGNDATLRFDLAMQEWQCEPNVRIIEGGGLEVDGDTMLGASDDDTHVIQGMTTFIGDIDDIIVTVLGRLDTDRLNVIDWARFAGGQMAAYYGYGGWTGGAAYDQYPGSPYWGSYPDCAVGPQHGTGTTIDRRGLRTDEVALIERGFMVYDVCSNTYLIGYPNRNDDGSITWEWSVTDQELNVP